MLRCTRRYGIVNMRECKRCKREWDEDGFRAKRGTCRECEREYDRDRYVRDNERRRAYITDWKARNPEVQSEYARRRRALKNSAEYQSISVEQMNARMSMFPTCWLCRKPIEDDDVHYEHVKPFSAGGRHTLSNLRPAHSLCNLVKGSRWMGTARLEELRMFVVLRVNELIGDKDDSG